MSRGSPKAKQSGWRPLRPGDTVDIIAPGYRAQDEVLELAVKRLTSWGLKARVPRRLFARDLLSSNRDEVRFEHLRAALLAQDSRVVWCLRGGYGSNRLLPQLDKVRAPKGPAKLLIGLSDITSLHLAVNQKWGWPSLHGPLLDRLAGEKLSPADLHEIKQVVFGLKSEISFAKLKALNEAARARRSIQGPVSGGNLTVLQSSLATAMQWQTAGKILFFEDTGERGYRIDRMLEQMRQAGLFQSARAVVFGQFSGGDEPSGGNLIWPVIRRFAQTLSIPVLGGLPSGHEKHQRPLPFGTRATLDLGERLLTVTTGRHFDERV